MEKTAPTKSYCGLCSRLRRGILYTHTQQIGAQRLALGHHRDDALETLLLNMVHQGTMKAMPARYVASRGVDVIRPLMYCAEDDLREYATRLEFPIFPCNLCGSQPAGKPRSGKAPSNCFISWMPLVGTAKTSGRTCSAPCRTCGPRIYWTATCAAPAG